MPLTEAQEDEMYDNVACPRCEAPAGDACMDLRRMGFTLSSVPLKPHRERVVAYRKWKKALQPRWLKG